ncbi:TB2/DP1, HVA22 family-domain-containing protein [Lentinula edodes]|uniref:Protein YOP1 n=1 Tax=Lentinula edodes TaxID=5353 RepID=A0A1Q3EB12_LENED|nr:TB2/DP1, HVA22 family-domain-containing protein [Lentinula edodes]KAH7870785.1 TB2/DP1, HVA22 family-domain-containing protein [Lentinula edodes]KAJ3895484.1 TB2/DP1, HVA22 family-domain-containing protein [Lentinula edodes]KAJ3910126.1 TB2/DP1, HVA22 family-domain-containing protein [Lentinula edodes]GAW04417.1 receptor expression-enhancing protein 4 [Lentinula edodes]
MFSIFFSVLCSWFAFFLPCYATYKTLSQRPTIEADVQKWCMYWSVVGAFVGFEHVAGWLVSWLPFYWEIKTVFLLFLSLPQIQGSTFVYNSYMQPFFAKNEREIDAGIVSIQSNVLSFVQSRLYALWELLWSVLSKTPVSQGNINGVQQTQPAAPGISLDSAMGLFKTYGPSLLNSLKPAATPNGSAPTPPSFTPTTSSSSVSTMSAQSGTPLNEGPHPPFPEPVHMS